MGFNVLCYMPSKMAFPHSIEFMKSSFNSDLLNTWLGVVLDNKLYQKLHIAQTKKTNIQSLWKSFKAYTLLSH